MRHNMHGSAFNPSAESQACESSDGTSSFVCFAWSEAVVAPRQRDRAPAEQAGVGVGVGVGVAGGGGGGGGGSGSTPIATNRVGVNNNVFDQANIQISRGTTVTWTWAADATLHNVTFTDGVHSADLTAGTFQR